LRILFQFDFLNATKYLQWHKPVAVELLDNLNKSCVCWEGQSDLRDTFSKYWDKQRREPKTFWRNRE